MRCTTKVQYHHIIHGSDFLYALSAQFNQQFWRFLATLATVAPLDNYNLGLTSYPHYMMFIFLMKLQVLSSITSPGLLNDSTCSGQCLYILSCSGLSSGPAIFSYASLTSDGLYLFSNFYFQLNFDVWFLVWIIIWFPLYLFRNIYFQEGSQEAYRLQVVNR